MKMMMSTAIQMMKESRIREDESTEDENIKLLDDSEDNIDINPEHNEQK